jgi:N-acyl homoserine lactone hydrolase
MATAAEPRPAELPLAGGRAGAKVRLHPLLTATVQGPPAWFLREKGRLAGLKAFGFRVPKDRWLTAPIVAFLVEHPTAGAVVIDTGFHASVAVKPSSNLGRVGGLLYREIDMRPEQAVVAQLRARGIGASDVRAVIMTHLHPDHASAISDFPDAAFLVSDVEWAAATDGGARQGYVHSQFDHGFDYRLVDFGSASAN